MSSSPEKTKILVLVGPTSVGKTGLSLDLAQRFGAEIISADSMQVYRGMDIGTAKPSPREMQRVPHHLIDVADPDEPFNAKRYQRAADRAVDATRGRGNVPLVVGGTGLYVKALLHGLFPDADPETDKPVRPFPGHEDKGPAADPYTALLAVDPDAARRIHPNDRVRARRALEVFTRTGKSITVWQARHRFREDRYEALVLGLRMDRERLYRRIEQRVDLMLRGGLMEEVRHLLQKGYAPQLPSMQSLGYRHMAAVISGSWSLEDAVRTMKRDTRRYAKRQMTWFQKQETVNWFERKEASEKISAAIQRFVKPEVKQIVEKPLF